MTQENKEMENAINLHDVQGVIMYNYADFGYQKTRYLFLKITNEGAGRKFVKEILPQITSAAFTKGIKGYEFSKKLPAVTTNISFTFNGLQELGVPTLTLKAFPDEFIMGIRNRVSILGDNEQSSPSHWDPIYQDDIHISIAINARNTDQASDTENMEKAYSSIREILDKYEGVVQLKGCKDDKNDNAPYQDSSVLYKELGTGDDKKIIPTAKEHFGYTDGISNPYFKGMIPEMGSLLGGGKKVNYGCPESEENWAPIETGEFILGYRDEANEYPVAPVPKLFSKNGSFMVFSKFHENVGAFNNYLDSAAEKYQMDKEELAAKFVGRWRHGAPIATFPDKAAADEISKKRLAALAALGDAKTEEDWEKCSKEYAEVNKKFIAFDYNKDVGGGRCPIGSHIRRVNPRGALEMGNKNAFQTPAALTNRRRIIRRGLPYGISTPDSQDGNHGTIVVSIVSSIKRQFEFVIEQWMNYGNDFRLANDKDPIIGRQDKEGGRMVIEGDENTPPKFIAEIPRFIETKGGVYLFMPSVTSLNLIGEGIVDPT